MTIPELVQALKEAREEYYHGKPTLSDAAFDALENELRKKDPNNAYFAEVGAPVGKTGWAKVNHPVEMGSLSKAQDMAEFKEWSRLRGIKGNFFVSEKLDGISVLLTYDADGNFVRGSTRGDGVVGEDITRNVRIMGGVPAKIENETGGALYIRGEIVCYKSIHPIKFPEDSNPRNTASGTAKRQHSGWQKARHLNVYVYRLDFENEDCDIASAKSTKIGRIKYLKHLGFDTPNYSVLADIKEVENYYEWYIEDLRAKLDYDIDGLVIETADLSTAKKLGSHKGVPKGSVALKFPHEAQTTKLIDVIWQTGNTGRITPVAVFETVSLAGANVSRASLHTVARLESLKLYAGCEILVSRRNDVIPMVEGNVSEGIFLQ